MPNNNDQRVGAIWKKRNERGTQWLGLRIDIEHILALTGGDVGQVNLVAFSRPKTTDEQPDYEVLWAKTQPAQSSRPNTPRVQDTDMGEMPGTVSYRRRQARER